MHLEREGINTALVDVRAGAVDTSLAMRNQGASFRTIVLTQHADKCQLVSLL